MLTTQINENPKIAVMLWLVLMSLTLYVIMGEDKRRAKLHKWRIPEKTLFILALVGGAAGGTLGMLYFHHKTKHLKFVILFPILTLLQILLYLFVPVLQN